MTQFKIKENETAKKTTIAKKQEFIVLVFEDEIEKCFKILKDEDSFLKKTKAELLALKEFNIPEETIKELFNQLLLQFKENEELIFSLIKEKNTQELHKKIHYLKGACLELRLATLSFILKTIDNEILEKKPIYKIKSLIDKLYSIIDTIIEKEAIVGINSDIIEKIQEIKNKKAKNKEKNKKFIKVIKLNILLFLRKIKFYFKDLADYYGIN